MKQVFKIFLSDASFKIKDAVAIIRSDNKESALKEIKEWWKVYNLTNYRLAKDYCVAVKFREDNV